MDILGVLTLSKTRPWGGHTGTSCTHTLQVAKVQAQFDWASGRALARQWLVSRRKAGKVLNLLAQNPFESTRKGGVSCLVIFCNFGAEKLSSLVCSYFSIWCTLLMYLGLYSPEWRSQLQGRRGDHIYVELITFQDCLRYCTYTSTYSIYLDRDCYRRHMAFLYYLFICII